MKKYLFLLGLLISLFGQVFGQAQIQDTATLRFRVNTDIVPNSGQGITAQKLNNILNGNINVLGNLLKTKTDSVWLHGDTVFVNKNGSVVYYIVPPSGGSFNPSANQNITADLWQFPNKVYIGGNEASGIWNNGQQTIVGDWAGNGDYANTNLTVDASNYTVQSWGVLQIWGTLDGNDYATANAQINLDGTASFNNSQTTIGSNYLSSQGQLYLGYGQNAGLVANGGSASLGDWDEEGNNSLLTVDDNAQTLSFNKALNLLNGGRSGITTPNTWQTRVGTPGGWNGTFLQVDDNAENVQIWCYDWDEDNAMASFNGDGSGVLAYSNISWGNDGGFFAQYLGLSNFQVDLDGTVHFENAEMQADGKFILPNAQINTNGSVVFDAGAITSNGYGALSAYSLTINSDVDNSSASLSPSALQFSYSDDGGGSTTSMYSANNVGISYTDDYGETSYTSLDYAAVSGGYVAEGVALSSWLVSSSGISLSYFGSTFFFVDGAGNIEASSINLGGTEGTAISVPSGVNVVFDGGDFTSDGIGNVTATSFRPNTFTNTTMDEIPSPSLGQIVYNSDLETLCFYTGDGWKAVTSSFP